MSQWVTELQSQTSLCTSPFQEGGWELLTVERGLAYFKLGGTKGAMSLRSVV